MACCVFSSEGECLLGASAELAGSSLPCFSGGGHAFSIASLSVAVLAFLDAIAEAVERSFFRLRFAALAHKLEPPRVDGCKEKSSVQGASGDRLCTSLNKRRNDHYGGHS